MDDTKKNSLAELAKDLNAIADWANGGHGFTAIIKAQLIVAELAKVMPNYMAGKPGHSFIETEAYKAYKNCRAIAEEGGAK